MEQNRPYRPSNSSEGDGFMERHCYQCIHEKWSHTMNDGDCKCDILSRTLLFDLKDKEYPTEWIYGDNGKPTCTAFKHWDWGNNEDGWNEPPPPPEPDNPNQMCLPFLMNEIAPITKEKLVEQHV